MKIRVLKTVHNGELGYIVKLSDNKYLAIGYGHPPFICWDSYDWSFPNSIKIFRSIEDAEKALKNARKITFFPDATIEEF